jgi:hypothetical protein
MFNYVLAGGYTGEGETIISGAVSNIWNVWLFGVGGIFTVIAVMIGVLYVFHILRKWISSAR